MDVAPAIDEADSVVDTPAVTVSGPIIRRK
jgi:hypothetical protein